MRRKVCGGLVPLLLLGVCGALVWAGGQSEAPEAPETPKTITWVTGSWWQAAGPGIVEQFEKSNPMIKVDFQTIPFTGYLDKLLSYGVSPNAPEVVALASPDWMPVLADRGLLAPLDQYVTKSDKIKKEAFFPAPWELCNFRGQRYALPYRLVSWGYYYNTRMFKEVGLDPDRPPTSFDEQLEYAKKITIPGKRYGIGMPGTIKEPSLLMASLGIPIWAYGGDFTDKDATRITINEPAALKGVKWWTDLFTRHKVVPEASLTYTINDVGRLFGAETIGMYTAGDYGHGNIKETATPTLEYKVAMEPPGKSTWLNTWAHSVYKNSKNKDAAWTFIEWFSDPVRLPDITIRTPATKNAIGHPKWSTPAALPFLQSAQYGHGFPALPQFPEISQIIGEKLHAVITAGKSVEDAMNEAAQEANKLLK